LAKFASVVIVEYHLYILYHHNALMANKKYNTRAEQLEARKLQNRIAQDTYRKK
jgi:hypothetical protein